MELEGDGHLPQLRPQGHSARRARHTIRSVALALAAGACGAVRPDDGRRVRLARRHLRFAAAASRALLRPHRHRARDVRPGEQRTLPPQDLRREVHNRRQGDAQLALRDDQEHPQEERQGHACCVQGQFERRGGLPHRDVRHGQRATNREPRLPLPQGPARSADEGGDAQPPHGDLALSGRRDWRGRRDPRRGRDGQRLAFQRGHLRLHGERPPHPRRAAAVGARVRRVPEEARDSA